jgi:hypothetical protein
MQLTRSAPSLALRQFVDEVGGLDDGPVSVAGAGLHWHLGGTLDAGVRTIAAPSGVLAVEADEMVIRCGAGTPMRQVNAALDEVGQICPLDPADEAATVGGLLAAGLSGHRRLRFGAARDLLLEAQFVTATGELLRAGAPVVKNVSGYDVCRLLVGSFGTVGLMGEVVLRCRPRPQAAAWYRIDGVGGGGAGIDPDSVRISMFAPSSVLWDGSSVWVLIEGDVDDLAVEAAALQRWGAIPVECGPDLPTVGRLSLNPADLRKQAATWSGAWVAEVGIGTVHTSWEVARGSVNPLELSIKRAYDPTRRLSPGRLGL